ncbi:MAG TPA: succinate dehydrogenase [Terriglobales bacterium]|nr:succinate dehydrogenase [Terriglobales bacterium]
MASASSTAPVAGAKVSPKVHSGVAPLRAGQGHSFFWRRLHSLSGIFPIGAFLVEHFFSNAFATNGAAAYNDNVRFLTGLPFVFYLELFLIWIPLAYHAGYGFYIWYRGDTNVGDYPWTGNWLYTTQRWTGAIAFFYIGWHVWSMRFNGVHLLTNSAAAFWKVQNEFHHPWAVAFYFVGIIAASWHFGYGLWLFAAKWGFFTGENARRKFGVVCFLVAVAFIAVGTATMVAFLTSPQVPPPANIATGVQ